jgi:hypothetical protein
LEFVRLLQSVKTLLAHTLVGFAGCGPFGEQLLSKGIPTAGRFSRPR